VRKRFDPAAHWENDGETGGKVSKIGWCSHEHWRFCLLQIEITFFRRVGIVPTSTKATKAKETNPQKKITMSQRKTSKTVLSGPSKLHPKTHQLLVKSLATVSASASASSLNATLARLILLLDSYGRVSPVVPTTPVGQAQPDSDLLGEDINARWSFPKGNKFRNGDIDGTEQTQTLALDIENRGGVINGK